MTVQKIILSLTAAVALSTGVAHAQFVIDTAEPATPVRLGLRAGVNVANVSNNEEALMPAIFDRSSSWRAGFTGGVVVDVRIRNFIAIQPGVLFNTHSASYMRTSEGPEGFMTSTTGTFNIQTVQVPVLFSFRTQYGSNLEFHTDFGPYFSYGIGGSEKYTVTRHTGDGNDNPSSDHKRPFYGEVNGLARRFDWGFKMGVGLEVADHFYIGAHYLAGCKNILNPNACNDPNAEPLMRSGACGRTRGWEFLVGYNF